jgi:hypothetical protein
MPTSMTHTTRNVVPILFLLLTVLFSTLALVGCGDGDKKETREYAPFAVRANPYDWTSTYNNTPNFEYFYEGKRLNFPYMLKTPKSVEPNFRVLSEKPALLLLEFYENGRVKKDFVMEEKNGEPVFTFLKQVTVSPDSARLAHASKSLSEVYTVWLPSIKTLFYPSDGTRVNYKTFAMDTLPVVSTPVFLYTLSPNKETLLRVSQRTLHQTHLLTKDVRVIQITDEMISAEQNAGYENALNDYAYSDYATDLESLVLKRFQWTADSAAHGAEFLTLIPRKPIAKPNSKPTAATHQHTDEIGKAIRVK